MIPNQVVCVRRWRGSGVQEWRHLHYATPNDARTLFTAEKNTWRHEWKILVDNWHLIFYDNLEFGIQYLGQWFDFNLPLYAEFNINNLGFFKKCIWHLSPNHRLCLSTSLFFDKIFSITSISNVYKPSSKKDIWY
jgi:hypothetical protein